MKYRVEVKEEAQQDILDVAKWYEAKQSGLGQRFRKEVIGLLEYLNTNPLSHQRKYKENRELLLKHFPYVIVYRVINQTVFVLAVVACKQHPSKKRKE